MNGGVAELLLQVLDELQDLGLNGHVQSGGGLVADQDLGLAGQGNGDHNSLPHTAGVLEGVIIKPVLGIGDTPLLHQLQGTHPGFRLGAVLVLQDDGGNLLSQM